MGKGKKPPIGNLQKHYTQDEIKLYPHLILSSKLGGAKSL